MEQFNFEKHWGKFRADGLAVNCKTEDLANEFLSFCEQRGLEWSGGDSLLSSNNKWQEHESETCYWGRWGVSYSSINYCNEQKVGIIEFIGSNKEVKSNHPTTTTEETIKVIYHRRETIVLLKSEGKHYRGVSKCSSLDTYNKEEGFLLALERARDNQKEGRY